MGGNIRGITIQFNADTTKLDKSLREINNNTRKLDKELRNVDKALKFNPTSVELWRQKQDLLKKKIDETKNALDILKQKQAALDAAGVSKTSEEYRKLQREIIETESKLKHFQAEERKIGNVKLKAASEQFKEMGSKLESAGQAMMGFSRAAAAAEVALGALVAKSASWADDLNTMSKQYHISTQDLQMYSAAANLVDVDVETITKSHVKLEKSMSSATKGTGKQAEAFDKLGVSITDQDGAFRDSEDVWRDTIKALGEVENETERDTLAMDLLGKSASELNPLIEDGGEAYANLAETLEKYDLDFIDQETLDQANAFNDSIDTIKAIGLVAFQEIGTTLAAYLAPALEKVVDWIGQLANWLTNLDPQILAVIGVVAGVVAALAPVLIILGKLSTGVGALMSVLGMLSGPVGIVIAVMAALVAAGILVYKNWDKIKAKAVELKNKVVNTFNEVKSKITTIWNNIKTTITNAVTTFSNNVKSKINALKTTVTNVFNKIKDAITKPIEKAKGVVENAINKIKSIVNGAHLSLPHFKLPHFKINGGKLPWGIGGKGYPPSISVSWYKKGGIFDDPTLIGIGEAGPEAVVPLDKLWDKLDRIAESSAGGPIVINVYGTANMSVNELAAAVEQRLVQAQKRRQLAWQ